MNKNLIIIILFHPEEIQRHDSIRKIFAVPSIFLEAI